MEILLCPQCGANDLKPFGSFAYKCEACGTVLKDDEEEKPAPLKTHFVAPVSSFRYDDEHNLPSRIDGSTMDEPDTQATKIILVTILVLCGIGLLIWACFPGKAKPVEHEVQLDPNSILPENLRNMMKVSTDSIINSIPDGEQASYEQKGITVKNVELLSGGTFVTGIDLSTGQQLQISLVKPKGFTRTGKKVFIGISISVKDKKGNVLYSADDINKSKGNEGEDYLKYKEKCDISLLISDSFGFHGRGNYVIGYRVWDKKSKNEITGLMPVFVAN
jgi:hypothetical protein